MYVFRYVNKYSYSSYSSYNNQFFYRFYNGPDYEYNEKCSCKDSVDREMKEFDADDQLWCCNGTIKNLTEQCPNQEIQKCKC